MDFIQSNISFTRDLHKRLKDYSERNKISLAEIVRKACEAWLFAMEEREASLQRINNPVSVESGLPSDQVVKGSLLRKAIGKLWKHTS